MSTPSLDAEAGESAELPRIDPIPAEALPLVHETIERLRPGVQRDGGDLELVAVQDNIVRLRLKGACVGCAMSGQTLGGVRRELVKVLGNPSVRVLPAP